MSAGRRRCSTAARRSTAWSYPATPSVCWGSLPPAAPPTQGSLPCCRARCCPPTPASPPPPPPPCSPLTRVPCPSGAPQGSAKARTGRARTRTGPGPRPRPGWTGYPGQQGGGGAGGRAPAERAARPSG
eukprot:1190018-Prorocentrum_minimum.AAC.1